MVSLFTSLTEHIKTWLAPQQCLGMRLVGQTPKCNNALLAQALSTVTPSQGWQPNPTPEKGGGMGVSSSSSSVRLSLQVGAEAPTQAGSCEATLGWKSPTLSPFFPLLSVPQIPSCSADKPVSSDQVGPPRPQKKLGWAGETGPAQNRAQESTAASSIGKGLE